MANVEENGTTLWKKLERTKQKLQQRKKSTKITIYIFIHSCVAEYIEQMHFEHENWLKRLKKNFKMSKRKFLMLIELCTSKHHAFYFALWHIHVRYSMPRDNRYIHIRVYFHPFYSQKMINNKNIVDDDDHGRIKFCFARKIRQYEDVRHVHLRKYLYAIAPDTSQSL